MEQNSAQTIATFTGTLLRRDHNLGERFVQLVFREGGKNWLCVSSNLADTRWNVGQNYRIEGEFKQIGERGYIHEPHIAPLKSNRKLLWRVSIIGGIVILAIGGLAFGMQGHTKPLAANNVSHVTVRQASTVLPGNSSAATAPTTASTVPTESTPSTVPVTVKTTKHKVTPITVPTIDNSKTTPQSPSASTQPDPNSTTDTSGGTNTTDPTTPSPDPTVGTGGTGSPGSTGQGDPGQTQGSTPPTDPTTPPPTATPTS